MELSKWDKIKNYVNTHEMIIRKELNKELLIGSTSDNYLNLLEKSGFLKTIGFGKKQRIYPIPNSLSTNILQKIAYDYEEQIKYFKKYYRKLKMEKIKASIN